MSKKYYTIYKTTNIKNNKFYIGMHQTNDLDDEYLGSGKVLMRSVKYHGKENFHKKILYLLESRDEMIRKEIEIVNDELIGDSLCMNLKPGGEGGGGLSSPEHAYKFALAGNKATNYLMWSKDRKKHIDRISKQSKNYWENIDSVLKQKILAKFSFKNKVHTERSKEKISNSAKGKHEGNKNSQFGTCWITNKIESKKIKKGDLIPTGWGLGRKKLML